MVMHGANVVFRAAAPRLLFASWHCLIDPSSGAAISTRELLRLLAQRGWDVRVLCGPALDFENGESIPQLLADEHLTFRETEIVADCGLSATVLSYEDGGTHASLFLPHDKRQHPVPSSRAGAEFLRLTAQACEKYRPDVLLTYGGYWTADAMLQLAHEQGIRTVFWIHNFAYHDASLFRLVDHIIVPSQCAARHYRDALGLATTALPPPIDWNRVRCERPAGNGYVTFVNPQPHKGVFVFARIAEQLHRLRPHIPLLVVEGRAGVGWLERTDLDLSECTNLFKMANTPDSRDFYRVSRVLLVPSLCHESFGRVAAEAMINGIPVIGSSRGALPEVLGDAGLLLEIPDQFTPQTRTAPTADAAAPWVESVIRLWEDATFYDELSARCRLRAERWCEAGVGEEYDRLLRRIAGKQSAKSLNAKDR